MIRSLVALDSAAQVTRFGLATASLAGLIRSLVALDSAAQVTRFTASASRPPRSLG